MTQILRGRFTARRDEPFVLFIIGMKVHRLWAIADWLPVFVAMPRMISELRSNADSGLLGVQMFISPTEPVLLQYWRDSESLIAYARSAESSHYPAWSRFNRLVAKTGSVGIWHETYLVRPGSCENVYVNMPAWGLGAARGSQLVKAEGALSSAAGRMGAPE